MILLLESDRLLAKNLAKALQAAGHETIHVVNPLAAVRTAEKKLPNLIIMDLQLAGRSGVEFLFEFKSYPEWAGVPVIILSNLPPAEAKTCLESLAKLDIKNYFYKPTTSLAQLREAVSQLTRVG